MLFLCENGGESDGLQTQERQEKGRQEEDLTCIKEGCAMVLDVIVRLLRGGVIVNKIGSVSNVGV